MCGIFDMGSNNTENTAHTFFLGKNKELRFEGFFPGPDEKDGGGINLLGRN
jgi:hypothetical protein